MKAGIVIPSHQRPQGLVETIESIWAVHRLPICVVAKGYDRDFMEGVRQKYDVAVIVQDPSKRGPAAAVNQGFDYFIGNGSLAPDVIFRIDDDVRIHRGKANLIQTYLNAMEANPTLGIVSAWNRALAWRQRGQGLLARMTNPCQCVAFRVQALQEIGVFDEGLTSREDTDLTIRHFMAGWEVGVVTPEVTYDHVVPSMGTGSTLAEEKLSGREAENCETLARRYPFVRVSPHPKNPALRRVSYLPNLVKSGVVPKEFKYNAFEVAQRSA